ncbi:hypothetical protein [uncultured Paraglaciecola sp.]|uniref:hypothetical protein n=1 Tax=uncultured Paraglaciecola sp. TaxID=1765024 RepID=UPI00260FB97D|nr:hypothetical protein [uncultured Paraglaciecola sp.]
MRHNTHLQNPNIDVGLGVLCAISASEQTLSCADIAEVCSCSRSAISRIENRALRKAKQKAKILGLQLFLED